MSNGSPFSSTKSRADEKQGELSTNQTTINHPCSMQVYIYTYGFLVICPHFTHICRQSGLDSKNHEGPNLTDPSLPASLIFQAQDSAFEQAVSRSDFLAEVGAAKSREKPGCDSTLTNCINGTHLWGGIKEAAKSIVHLKEFPENNST